jgi:hypothetical protein
LPFAPHCPFDRSRNASPHFFGAYFDRLKLQERDTSGLFDVCHVTLNIAVQNITLNTENAYVVIRDRLPIVCLYVSASQQTQTAHDVFTPGMFVFGRHSLARELELTPTYRSPLRGQTTATAIRPDRRFR